MRIFGLLSGQGDTLFKVVERDTCGQLVLVLADEEYDLRLWSPAWVKGTILILKIVRFGAFGRFVLLWTKQTLNAAADLFGRAEK